MKQELVKCKSRQTAYRRCPWAVIVAKCWGGFMAFESMADYEIWKKQK